MKLKEIYNSDELIISFEVFPPKGEENEYNEKVNNLFNELNKLTIYKPSLISVTYGAGGSTRDKTFDLVLKIKNELKIDTLAHFTCVNMNKSEILSYAKKLETDGIENILALRGDPPIGQENFVAPKDGFSHANELVTYLKENTNLSVAVAGYPEKHPEAIDFSSDINNLKRKVEAGADVIYTQLFLDNNDYYNFVDKANKAGIKIPIIPGIMVLQTTSQIDRITNLSGSKLPVELAASIEKHKDNADDIRKIGIEHAIKQVKQLKSFGVKGLHFYPLNKAFAVSNVLSNL